ncbi:mitochondrial metalloendopeptidase OMA1-like [Wolffia australiana]
MMNSFRRVLRGIRSAPWPGSPARSRPIEGRRFFYVGRDQVQHFRRRRAHRWFESPRTVVLAVAVGGAATATVYYGNAEAVPYTKRTHVVLLSPRLER